MLNTDQLIAIQSKARATLVLAGVGTGKTTVITQRIKYLISQGVDPSKILAITFTNKAAEEMKERLDREDVHISTIHSFCYQLLRRYGLNPRIEKDQDFGRLVIEAIQLIKKNRPIQDEYTDILIDEYQDVSKPLHRLIELLVGKRNRLFAVGDDDQAIFGFCGASNRYILKFKRYFKDVQVVPLGANYRTPRNIFEIATNLIKANRRRHHKELKAVKEGGEIIHLSFESRIDEARVIIQEIGSLKDKYPFEEIAILYRHHRRAKTVKRMLSDMKGYPFEIPFSESREKRNGLSLLTFHSAKGLEFGVVFILQEELEQREEERRVLYVGLTRAKERIYLSRIG